jgi:drug/metabolite transporter (DMT)-like permease
MPKPYVRLAIVFGSVGLVLTFGHLPNNGLVILPIVAAITYAAFWGAYLVWRFQSRRRGDAA